VSMEVVTQLDKQLRALKVMEPETKWKIFVLRMVLNEGKKRHIRRLRSSIWGEVLDLVRIKIGDHTIDKLDEEESRVV
jgi:16S rRNA U516 pseudouridylate synthase RsuA-like enzyme